MRPTWIVAVVVVMLAAGIAAYSADSMGPTASNSGISTANNQSGSLGSSATSSSISQTSTSSTISRVADTQSTTRANVTPSSSTTTLTGTNTTASNCPPPGGVLMQLQVVSDTTGMPVQQGTVAVSAVYQTGCDVPGDAGILHLRDTLYLERISEGSSGWFDLPSLLGGFNFTVGYAGHTYLFRTGSWPASTTCVTLAVPSGVVTATTYELSNYDCAGNLGAWAGQYTHCYFGEVYLRLLSDSGADPVAGAVVTTAYDFAVPCYTSPNPCLNPSNCGEAFKNFTTTSTEWYAFGDSADSFSVEYGGQTYNVTASQTVGSTCVTMHVPSGVVDTTYGASCAAAVGSSFTFAEPSTSTSTTVNSPTCGGNAMNTLLNPALKGTVYMKVVDEQGTVITNGSLDVTQVGNTTGNWVTSGLVAHYCISLSDVNATGYLQLGGNATFLASGYYNLTLVAGYNQGPGYMATIPSIQVHPNSTIYVTVSVPSGVVTVVTSNEGSNAVTTTTTSATTIKNGG
jgi:hypothetical protein